MMKLAQSTLHLSFNPAQTVLGVTKRRRSACQHRWSTRTRSSLTSRRAIRRHQRIPHPGDPVPPPLHHPAPSLNFAVTSENAHYGTVSITLTGGTVDQGDLITLNITLVVPASAKSAPSAADQAADDAFVAWIVSGAGRAQLKKGGYPLTPPVYIGAKPA